MADRFFPNEMPDFVEEAASDEQPNGSSLTKLLSSPYKTHYEMLRSSAIDIKEMVVKQTWVLSGKRVEDYNMYTGALGTALLVFKAYQVTKNQSDLKLCSKIVKACDSASRDSRYSLVHRYTDPSCMHCWLLPEAKRGSNLVNFSNTKPNINVYNTTLSFKQNLIK